VSAAPVIARASSAGVGWRQRHAVSRTIGKVRLHKRLRRGGERWRIDLRREGHGFVTAAPDPVTGELVLFRSRDSAADALESIRGAYASGKSLDSAVAAYTRARTATNCVPARVEAWLARRREDAAAGDISPMYLRELERYAHAPGYFPWWHDITIWDVNTGLLDDWSRAMAAQKLSGTTRRKVLGGFHAFLADLVRRGDLDRVPVFPRIPADEYVPRTTTIEVQDAIIAEIPEDRRGAFLAARLGVRPGEVRALNVGDYDRATRVLTIRAAMKGPTSKAPRRGTKERNVRRVRVDAELAAWIEAHVAPGGALVGAPLFVNPTARRADSRWLGSPLRREWDRAAARVGVRVRMYEGTKHTTATEALRAGASMDAIQAALGHRDRKSTQRYARMAEIAPVGELFRRRHSGPRLDPEAK
jgi:integrase